MTNVRAIWLRSGAFLTLLRSLPVPSLHYYWPLVTGHWPLFSGHWPLATILSPLASRYRPPHAPRSTPSTAPPAGSGHAQTLPRWLLPVKPTPNWQRSNEARTHQADPLIHYSAHRRFLRTNPSVPRRSPLPSCCAFARIGGGRVEGQSVCLPGSSAATPVPGSSSRRTFPPTWWTGFQMIY
jgi:hypothetical protein